MLPSQRQNYVELFQKTKECKGLDFKLLIILWLLFTPSLPDGKEHVNFWAFTERKWERTQVPITNGVSDTTSLISVSGKKAVLSTTLQDWEECIFKGHIFISFNADKLTHVRQYHFPICTQFYLFPMYQKSSNVGSYRGRKFLGKCSTIAHRQPKWVRGQPPKGK